MEKEAAIAGLYIPEHFPDQKYPRIQILTVEEVLQGRQIEYPRTRDMWQLQAPGTYKRARRKTKTKSEGQKRLL